MILKFLEKYREKGLLILRIGLGISFMFHGGPKLFSGIEKWEKIGGALEVVGIEFFPAFWGFMASFSEFFGGFFLLLGLFSRVACLLLTMVMLVASISLIAKGDPFQKYSHPVENGIVFLSLFFIGPGRYSIDHWLNRKKNNSGSDMQK